MTDSPNIDPVWLVEFEAAARRPLAMRWRYAFVRIIMSKAAANRVKDRESLPRLRAFREYLRRQPRR